MAEKIALKPWLKIEKGHSFNGSLFEQTWITFNQRSFVPQLVEIGQVVLEEIIFLILSMHFRYFIIISPWKRAGPFIFTNLNILHPRMLCAKFGWNWPSGSEEEYENVKSLQTDRWKDKQTDDGRQVIRNAHLSLQLRWAKKSVSMKILVEECSPFKSIVEWF